MVKTMKLPLKTKVIIINFNKLNIAFYILFCIVRTLNIKFNNKTTKKAI